MPRSYTRSQAVSSLDLTWPGPQSEVMRGAQPPQSTKQKIVAKAEAAEENSSNARGSPIKERPAKVCG